MSGDEDDETLLELTAKLQLEDIEEWRASRKGKGRVGVVSDAEVSFNTMEAEHKALLRCILDRRIARSAERAMAQDRDLIEALTAIEEREQADRKLALLLSASQKAEASQASVQTSTSQAGSINRLSQGSSSEPRPDALMSLLEQILSSNGSRASIRAEASQAPTQANTSQSAGSLHGQFESPSLSSLGSNSDLMTSLLEILSLNSSTTSVSTIPKSEVPSAPTNANNPQVAAKPPSTTGFVPSVLRLAGGRSSAQCVICNDIVTQAYQAPCGCFYDRECLTEFFEKATVDESLFPPRCCNRRISFKKVRSVFSPELVRHQTDYTATTPGALRSWDLPSGTSANGLMNSARHATAKPVPSVKDLATPTAALVLQIRLLSRFFRWVDKNAGSHVQAATNWLNLL